MGSGISSSTACAQYAGIEPREGSRVGGGIVAGGGVNCRKKGFVLWGRGPLSTFRIVLPVANQHGGKNSRGCWGGEKQREVGGGGNSSTKSNEDPSFRSSCSCAVIRVRSISSKRKNGESRGLEWTEPKRQEAFKRRGSTDLMRVHETEGGEGIHPEGSSSPPLHLAQKYGGGKKAYASGGTQRGWSPLKNLLAAVSRTVNSKPAGLRA